MLTILRNSSLIWQLGPRNTFRRRSALRTPRPCRRPGVGIRHVGSRARLVSPQAKNVSDIEELQHADKGFHLAYLFHRPFPERRLRGSLASRQSADSDSPDQTARMRRWRRGQAGSDRCERGATQPIRPRLSQAVRGAGPAGAGPRLWPDPLRCEPDAVAAGRHVGAASHPFRRRRICLCSPSPFS
jgi:hypothetical protein